MSGVDGEVTGAGPVVPEPDAPDIGTTAPVAPAVTRRRRLPLSPSAWVGAVMLGSFVLLGIAGPWLAPHPVVASAIDLENPFAPSSATHWLGTDANGYDALSQLLWGARSALVISMSVVLTSACIGVMLGTISGYFRGAVDEVVMRLVDILMAFPGILLNIAIVATVKQPGVGILIGALIANGWVGYARVTRGQVLSLRERDYVQAARAIGAGDRRIMARHVVPNLLAPVLVQMTFGFGTIILVEASLSFLGLGPQLHYTWGAMLSQATDLLWRPGAGRYALVPGLAIMWVVLGANLLGDGLRDRLDPRQQRSG
jgi:peptide/nickel transport system permease protein